MFTKTGLYWWCLCTFFIKKNPPFFSRTMAGHLVSISISLFLVHCHTSELLLLYELPSLSISRSAVSVALSPRLNKIHSGIWTSWALGVRVSVSVLKLVRPATTCGVIAFAMGFIFTTDPTQYNAKSWIQAMVFASYLYDHVFPEIAKDGYFLNIFLLSISREQL